MPLSIERGSNVPVLVCDHCEYEIRPIGRGDAVWLPDRNQVFTLHKSCTQLFGNTYESDPMRVQPLDVYLRGLMERLSLS